MSDAVRRLRTLGGAIVPPPGVYALDPAHTFAEFVAQHLVVGHVRGRFDHTTGTVTIAEDPIQSTIVVEIETATISTHNDRRDQDLRSPRFFDVAASPTMTFRSRAIMPELDGRWTINGDLTIRDVTRAVALAARITGVLDDPTGGTRVGLRVEGQVSRRDFDLLTDLARESGGVTYGADVAISVDAEAIRVEDTRQT